MKKKVIGILFLVILRLGIPDPCYAADMEGELILSTWDNDLINYMNENDMIGCFQKKYPMADITVEKIKDELEYWNIMEIRASANQLPDIMFNKPYTLCRFQDYLIDLSELEASDQNILAEQYAINGQILGIPITCQYNYVYYWKDLFADAGVTVPETWEEFENISLKLQKYYESKKENFSAVAIGVKDEWTTYPFMEFMPALESGNGNIWNDMVKKDSPFSENTDVFQAYEKIYQLFTLGVCGDAPLDRGNTQAVRAFTQKDAAMIALGDWGLKGIEAAISDDSSLGAFYLPVRNTKDIPFRIMIQGDPFMGVTAHSKNPDLAKAFVEWFYSEEWYPGYINYVSGNSAMATFPKEKPQVLLEADQRQPEVETIIYKPINNAFRLLQNEVEFDYRKFGTEMFTEDFQLYKRLQELDRRWKTAKRNFFG